MASPAVPVVPPVVVEPAEAKVAIAATLSAANLRWLDALATWRAHSGQRPGVVNRSGTLDALLTELRTRGTVTALPPGFIPPPEPES